MKKLPFFLLILLLIIICVHSQVTPPTPAPPPLPPSPPLPSMMRYVLQWPPTLCMTLENGRCKEPIPENEFLLHGLWPADENGNVMGGTPKPPDQKWNATLVKPLEVYLIPFWRSLKENFNNMGLYKHEFKRHGIWAQTGVEEYFKTSIRINNISFVTRNLYNYLETSNIIASDTSGYTENDIVDAIQKVFASPTLSPSPTPPHDPFLSPAPAPSHDPFNIYLSCTSINAKLYLNEVTLCTYPNGTRFISCPHQIPDPLRRCDGANIMLPLARAQPPIPSPPSPPPPKKFQEEEYGTYPTFERSWAKYIFNGWI